MVASVEEISVIYTQEADCCSEEPQQLKVFTANNGLESFLVFETQRWAIDDIQDLIDTLKDFKVKAGMEL